MGEQGETLDQRPFAYSGKHVTLIEAKEQRMLWKTNICGVNAPHLSPIIDSYFMIQIFQGRYIAENRMI